MNQKHILNGILGGLGQERRLLKLSTTIGDDALLPQRVHARDEMSAGYHYTLDVLSLEPKLALKSLIAQEVTLWVLQGDKAYLPVHGYIHTVKQLGSDGHLSAYQLSFATCLHFLKFRTDAHIWQDRSAEDIVTDVLKGHPQCEGRFRFELDTPGRLRSYCTQYESDWHFVMRILETEGWYGYFVQAEDGSGHEWVITDSVQSLPPRGVESIEFHRGGQLDEVDKIVQWGAVRRLPHGQLSTVTSDYKAPRAEQRHNLSILPEHGSVPPQLEVYEYTGQRCTASATAEAVPGAGRHAG